MTEHNHSEVVESLENQPTLPIPRRGQFQFCELVDREAGPLIGFITEGDDNDKGAEGEVEGQ